MQPIALAQHVILMVGQHEDDPAHVAELVEAACANLARCRPGFKAPKAWDAILDSPVRVPTLFQLLSFFPSPNTLSLSVPAVGAQELAFLAEAGSFGSQVAELRVGSALIRPGFLTPRLWSALPALTELRLKGPAGERGGPLKVPWAEIITCLAAAPHPIRVFDLMVQGGEKAHAALAALPGGGKVELVGGGCTFNYEDDGEGDKSGASDGW